MNNSDNLPKSPKDIEIIQDDSFSYDGFQVVRGEFFSHTYEPSITFSKNKIMLNSACVKRLPDTDYVQMLVNPEEKKIAVLPCQEHERDSFRWRTVSNGVIKPKSITCNLFFARIMSIMNWNPDYRYKLLGKLIESHGQLLFSFDLKSPEIFIRKKLENGKEKSSRKPVYPEEWKNQFGLPFNEHQQSVQVDIFNGYAVFNIEKKTVDTDVSSEHDMKEGAISNE